MKHVSPPRASHHHSLVMYVSGYIFSLALTLLAFLAVQGHFVAAKQTLFLIIALSVVQLAVQSIFFLHLGAEPHVIRRWNVSVFFFAIFVAFTVVLGSLWIMSNLNYNMMMPDASDTYMLHQENMQVAPVVTN